jgi:hypothetical protein
MPILIKETPLIESTLESEDIEKNVIEFWVEKHQG